MTEIYPVTIATVFILMQTVILAESIAVFSIVLCRRTLRTIPNFYVLSLSASDFLVGAFFATSAVIAALKINMADEWCRFIITMELLSYTAGSCSLLALSVDRYRATCNAANYRPTVVSTVCIIVGFWLLSSLYCLRNVIRFELNGQHNSTEVLSPIWCNTFLGNQSFDLHFRALDFFIVFLAPGIIMSVLYTKIYLQVKRALSIAPTTSSIRKRRIVKMLIIQVCVFFVSWLPIYLHDLTREIQQLSKPGQTLNTSVNLEYLEVFLVLVHSVVNPILYAYYNTNFSRELSELRASLTCMSSQKNEVHPVDMEMVSKKPRSFIPRPSELNRFTTSAQRKVQVTDEESVTCI